MEDNNITEPTEDNKAPSRKDRYEILIRARNFHYENFNKWMTYFYVATGALFIGYCTLIASEKGIESSHEYLIAILGFIVSLLWYWSAKGYYYWNINFINLVNHYERDLFKLPEEERVYFVFANTKTENNLLNPISGANISTSKIAILFAFIITSFWGLIPAVKLSEQISGDCICCKVLFALTSPVSVLLLSKFLAAGLKSNQTGFPDLGFQLQEEKGDVKKAKP